MSRALWLAAALASAAGCKSAPGSDGPPPPPAATPTPPVPPVSPAAPSGSPAEAGSPTPSITATPRLQGCTTENIRAVVRPHRDEVTRCYRKVLAKNPAARGKLAVEVHIDKAGAGRFLGVQTDDFSDEEFTRCVFAVMKPLPYPIPETEPCILVYPFVFTSGPSLSRP